MTNEISRTIDEMTRKSELRQKERDHNRRVRYMFNLEDTSVSLRKVSQEIKRIEENHEEEIKELSDEYANFMIKAKRDSAVKGTIKRDRDDGIGANIKWDIGLETPITIGNVRLFTGDQVTLRLQGYHGMRTVNGFIVSREDEHGERWGIMTNKEIIDNLTEDNLDYFKVKFVEHFMFLKHKDIIGKGNHGGEGFVVELS